MKKRKFCTLSQPRSVPNNNTTTNNNSISSQSVPRIHAPVSNSKLLQSSSATTTTTSKSIFSSSSRSKTASLLPRRVKRTNSFRREIYDSLESLFDLRKPIQLDIDDFLPVFDRPSLLEKKEKEKEEEPEREKEDSEVAVEFGSPEDFIEKLKPTFAEVEPHLVQSAEVNDTFDERLELRLAESLKRVDDNDDVDDRPPAFSDKVENPEASDTVIMADDEATPGAEENAEEQEVATTEGEGDAAAEQSEVTPEAAADKEDLTATTGKDGSKSIDAPSYPIPPGFGQGIQIGEGKRTESLMSSIPFTDSCNIQEVQLQREKANAINREIQELKKIGDELSKKEELTEEDTILLRDTQASIMEKIRELDEITRKMQRTIGLIDPSTATFAKMFEMLPYPHRPDQKKDGAKVCEKVCAPQQVCEKFAFPEVDYPEDKLPRVIVCGNTEENFPKIVVADSRPKLRGKKCIENLAGKLTESLSMQEKLTKENAQLEGGKCKLERELSEKDDAVESLQRKICGLQAEMRIVMKENCELSRKLTCIAQQQQQQQSRSCSPVHFQNSRSPSPRSPCLTPTKQTDCYSPKRSNDLTCKCSARGAERTVQPAVETPPGCDSRIPSPCRDQRPLSNCRRLAGGASRGGDDFLSNNRQDMYSRNANSYGCQQHQQPPRSPPPPSRGEQHTCPADIEERLHAYGNNTKHLGDQLSCMETEVRMMQSELCKMQRERQQLEQQRKLLECANPCPTCVCCPEPPKAPSMTSKINLDSSPCLPCSDVPECVSQQLRDLREQYARLQDDYKSKLCEVSRLRTDSESLRRESRESKEERERLEIKLIDAQERLRAAEAERNDLLGAKEQFVEQEQALMVARQRFREAQDELEELRTMIRDQAAQLDDYRNKYLQAQQIVEEQRRQLDLMEMDNARMNENVTLEIGRVKSQFQEKLAELAPLPDILKQTQMKLQECQQLRMLAEHNCEDLSRELLGAKDKMEAMQTQISDLQRELQALNDEKNNGGGRVDELERKNSELRTDNERLKNTVARLEEQQASLQKRVDEKQHEIAQLTAMLDQVREDSARQVSRTKERCEAIKRSMQAQISDFEIQLAQCRAAAKTAQKERDEIRQKMQGQIGNLNEALQQAQGRIRSLQGHVDYLKVSYSNVFGGQTQGEPVPQQMELPSTGYDSCDCNY